MSSNLITVSIIVAVYDGTEYLLATLNSILSQTHSNFEVLIFGNQSFKQTVKWFNYFQDPRLKFIFQKDCSISQSFNQGIVKARGKYICFLRVGDLWHPNKLQSQIFYLQHDWKIGLVYSSTNALARQKPTKTKAIAYEYSGWVESQLIKRNSVVLSSVMVRSRCFETVGLFDPQLRTIPEWDLWIRLSRRYQFIALNESLCRQKSGNSIHQPWWLMETDLQTTIEKAYNHASPELLHFKSHSYAHANLYLAKRVLEDPQPDYAVADNYCNQALEHLPSIGFTAQFLQARLGIMTLRCLKSDRYSFVLLLIRILQSLLEAVVHTAKKYSHNLLIWMLEEESLTFWQNQQIKRQSKDRSA